MNITKMCRPLWHVTIVRSEAILHTRETQILIILSFNYYRFSLNSLRISTKFIADHERTDVMMMTIRMTLDK
jgi:hypothetical protein